MEQPARHVAILGATGSIGTSTLEVLAAMPGRFAVVALTAHRRLAALCELAVRHGARTIVAADAALASEFDWSCLGGSARVETGSDAVARVASSDDVDLVVAAIVGRAGLEGTWAAVEAGKTVALANKETLVMAGPLVMDLARRRGATILPVDSEHSAVFQALRAGSRAEVRRIILTASGGPFRGFSAAQLHEVSVEQALAHPTWDMGPKITVDSATMMNKALEMIEARWLFELAPDQIEVVVHPQSIVHSMVEFLDGSVVAQLSPPDMKLPIQYALTYPERLDCPSPKLDIHGAFRLDFEPVDMERFPAIGLGQEVARSGGTAGAVLNAANEAAVAGFLEGKLGFADIVPACRSVLDHHQFDANPGLDHILKVDRWAREEVARWVCT